MPRSFFFLLSVFFVFATHAQTYPQQYFRNPLNIPMQLVANFGEIRTNHWHMGLDIRTQQRVNLPVHAAAEGFISRVSVEPGGFGQAIYITHPNGYTTLYAHLNAFFPALASYVKQQQYARESWRINLFLPEKLFPVSKGEFIGLSGSTGASEGPHVHFEIRDTKTENCLNPLLFRFPIADAVPPTITRLALYDRNRSTYLQAPQLLSLKKSGGVYTVGTGFLRVASDRISFALGAVDRFTATPNPNGIYSVRLSLDDTPLSEFVLDNISYDDTRYINAQLDLPYKTRGGASLQHLSPLPGALNVVYRNWNGDGVVYLKDTARHMVNIEVRDANGNLSRIRFGVQYDPSISRAGLPRPDEKFLPNQVNIFERENFELFTSEQTVYDTLAIGFAENIPAEAAAVSSRFDFLSNGFPAHDSFTVRIRPGRDLTEAERDRVVITNISGSRTYVQRVRWQKGWVAAKFRQFGSYQAFVDLEPPTVNDPPANLSRSSRIVFTPRDNFNAIRDFRVEVDGQWLRFSNDKGRSWIYHFDEYFPSGTHQLTARIEDEAGNVTLRSWTVQR